MGERKWTGGRYADREGIVVEGTEEGLSIAAWYDGGIGLEINPVVLSWDDVDVLRSDAVEEGSGGSAGESG